MGTPYFYRLCAARGSSSQQSKQVNKIRQDRWIDRTCYPGLSSDRPRHFTRKLLKDKSSVQSKIKERNSETHFWVWFGISLWKFVKLWLFCVIKFEIVATGKQFSRKILEFKKRSSQCGVTNEIPSKIIAIKPSEVHKCGT